MHAPACSSACPRSAALPARRRIPKLKAQLLTPETMAEMKRYQAEVRGSCVVRQLCPVSYSACLQHGSHAGLRTCHLYLRT